jgi:hypothetical protein
MASAPFLVAIYPFLYCIAIIKRLLTGYNAKVLSFTHDGKVTPNSSTTFNFI